VRVRGNDHYLGWVRALPGARANLPTLPLTMSAEDLPPSVDLSDLFPPPYDQAKEGSCVAQGWRAVMEALRQKEGLAYVPLSSQFLYWCVRALEGTTGYDSGAQIHDGSAALERWGICPEAQWPYEYDNMLEHPTPQAYATAEQFRVLRFSQIPNDEVSVKAALASGLPIVFGASVYTNFESAETARTGIVQMPQGSLLGGHCTVLKGYGVGTLQDHYYGRNSWGSWGSGGDYFLPAAYLHDPNLCDELTVAQWVT
jgi:C1A family cysteine protease